MLVAQVGMRSWSAWLVAGLVPMAEQDALEKLLFEQYNAIVIFLDPDLKSKYYHGFCRLYLAPIMHNQMHTLKSIKTRLQIRAK